MLLKKAFRSIWGNKKSYLACIVLIMLGVFLYVNFGISGSALQNSKKNYYENFRMADAFAKVRSIPKTALESCSIDGISDVMGRLVYDAQLDVPDRDKIMTLRLISVDSSISAPLNDITVIGEDFSAPLDIMVSDVFLTAHHLSVGDSVPLIIEGRRIEWNICATAQGPEYVYVISDIGDIMPDEEGFNVAYVQEDDLAILLDKSGTYNDVCFKFTEGTVYDDIKLELEDYLARFGLISLVPLKDQLSNMMVSMEIDSIVAMGDSVPMVFIIMSVVVLYLMLKRIIEQDRTQIGTLKAFGYTNTQILLHYMMYGVVTGVVGGILGAIYGYLASGLYLNLFNEFFKIPNLVRSNILSSIVKGVTFSVLGGALGAFMGAFSTIKLHPAEAMRPPTPITKGLKPPKNNFVTKKLLTAQGRMSLRSITRNKIRTGFVLLGIAFSFAILAFMGSFNDMIDEFMFVQYEKVQIYDGKMTFYTPTKFREGIESVLRLSGVTHAEGLLEVPVRFSHDNLSKESLFIGIEPDSALYKIYDTNTGKTLPLPADGAIFTTTLAKNLQVQKGDTIYINNEKEILVSDIVMQSLGTGAYIDKNLLADIMQTGDVATSVIFAADDLTAARDAARESRNILSFEDKQTTLKNNKDLMEPFLPLFNIFLLIGVVVAFVIIYNTSSITLMERKREYATLRVLGMQISEVAGILGFEYWILGGLGMLLGIPLSRFFKMLVAGLVDVDMFVLPTNVSLYMLFVGFAGCTLAIIWSNRSAIKNIKKLDMVEVLKERE